MPTYFAPGSYSPPFFVFNADTFINMKDFERKKEKENYIT